ncbi:SseB family protein [Streptomyces peucetius]|uniref:SseB family protein n=1 Tax=Streptomyces peucetius TaxID=1950 RepID=A0ABY6IF36_STRPE|nr:SseB family protein [Streptomyces peucetius]UYQ65621.1 SseB family protein [Streptomyces peucetius]
MIILGMNTGGGGVHQSSGLQMLADQARREAATSMSDGEKIAAARATRLYFQRPDQPGFLVCETELGPVVPLFTSVKHLALFAGACAWAFTTAGDIAELLPEGVRALVDPLSEQPFLLDVDALLEPAAARDRNRQDIQGDLRLDES